MRISRSVVAFGTWLWPWKIGRFAGIDTTLAPRGIINLIIGIGIGIGIRYSGSCLSGSNLRHDIAGFSTVPRYIHFLPIEIRLEFVCFPVEKCLISVLLLRV